MKKYIVEITETLQRIIEVEALENVTVMYKNLEIVLNVEDFADVGDKIYNNYS